MDWLRRIVVLERRRMAEFVSEIFETAAVAPGEALAFAGGRNESFQPKTVIELDGGRIAERVGGFGKQSPVIEIEAVRSLPIRDCHSARTIVT